MSDACMVIALSSCTLKLMPGLISFTAMLQQKHRPWRHQECDAGMSVDTLWVPVALLW